MQFTRRSNLDGVHALFSPSSPYWLNYDEARTIAFIDNIHAKERGTRLHAWAAETIELRRRQEKTADCISLYINDAIGYGMSTEVCLYYSNYFFGHCDAISFENNTLRIFDLKTGKEKGDMRQLKIYAALFCLDYGMSPFDLIFDLRIYQYDGSTKCAPDPSEIREIMDNIIKKDKILAQEL